MGEEAFQSESSVTNEEYSLPVLRFDVPPHRTYHFYRQFITPTNPNNFLKAVKWYTILSYIFHYLSLSIPNSTFASLLGHLMVPLFSPLPTTTLSASSRRKPSFHNLPPWSESDVPVGASDDDSFAANVVMHEGESIHDFCWYPYMSSSDPVTNVFATTTRDHPIHLWDATSGQLRCTYRAYDAMDEITAAFSIAFNPAGTKIYAGYNKCIRMFDLHRPGRDFELYSTVKDKKEGQTGIISAMAFSPFHSGMLALGSYNQSTAIYREDNMELLYVLHGQEGGITHVQFSRDGNYLYTGGRKDPYILCWDVRKSVDCVYKKILYIRMFGKT
ncbi:Telomerase Cajal body protein 1, partial [Mucuna pruriens]